MLQIFCESAKTAFFVLLVCLFSPFCSATAFAEDGHGPVSEWRAFYFQRFPGPPPGNYIFYPVPDAQASTPEDACAATWDFMKLFHYNAYAPELGPYELNEFPVYNLGDPETEPLHGHKCLMVLPDPETYQPHPSLTEVGWNSVIPVIILPNCADGSAVVQSDAGPRCNLVTYEAPDCECEEGDTPISGPPTVTVGNPIALDSGAKVARETDYTSADTLLNVERRYRSRNRNTANTLSLMETAGFGDSWHGLLPGHLVVSGEYMSHVEFLSPSGQTKHFNIDFDNWSIVAEGATRVSLEIVAPPVVNPREYFQETVGPVEAEGEMKLTFANGDYILFRRSDRYDSVRKERFLFPIEVGKANGYRQWFEYFTDDEYPIKVTDSLERELTIAWTEIGWRSTQLRGVYEAPDQVTPPAGMKLRKAISQLGLPDGTTLAYSYGPTDASGYLGRLETVQRLSDTDEILWGRTYLYEDEAFPKAITGILDQNDARLATYDYDETGRAILTERAGGVERYEVAYSPMTTDGSDESRTVTNPLGLETEYVFSGYSMPTEADPYAGMRPRRLLSVASAETVHVPAQSVFYNYDGQSLIQDQSDPNGNYATRVNDSAGRPSTMTNRGGVETALEWDLSLDLVTREIAPNLTTDYTYDAAGQLLSRTLTDTTTQTSPYVTEGQTRTTTYTWAGNGRLASVNGPRPVNSASQDDITSFTYDTAGNRLTMTNPLGHVTSYAEYDANGNPGEMTDPNGVTTVFAYDPLGRVESITVRHPTDAAKDAVTTLAYDVEGRIVGVTRPETAALEFDYDLAGRLLSMGSADGERIEFAYDAMDNVLSETVRRADDSQAQAITRTFDELGRVLTEALGPDRVTTWAYDANGNPTATTSPRGNTTTQAFDALDRLVSVAAPAAGTTATAYDEHDRLATFTDAKEVVTQFVRNGFGEVIQETSPDRGTSVYTYDEAGDLVSETDGRGQQVDYQRDILGRMTRKVPVGHTAETVHYDWDIADTETTFRIGRLTRIRDASGATVFNYDHRGNIVSQRQKLVGTPDWVWLRYAYDLADRVALVTYPSGRQVQYVRDDKGRVRTVRTRANAGSSWTALASGLNYEPFGALKTMNLGNGLPLVNNWGDDGRLAGKRLYRVSGGADVSRLTYVYDGDDNILRINDLVDPSRTQKFVYDAAGRVIRTDVASGTIQRTNYTYDENGNRLREHRRALPTDPAPLESDVYSYTDGTNQLWRVKTGGNSRLINYDGRGNTASETRPAGGTLATAYDGYGRLTGYDRSDVETLSFVYNGRDDRVAMTRGANTRRFVYDPEGRVLGEYGTSATDVKAEFIWLSPEVANDNEFGGDDGVGGYAPLAVATSAGVNWVHGGHLGVPLVTTDALGAPVATPGDYLAPGFPGQSRVSADLYYNRYRDYDPTTGRYIQADPIGLAGGANLYLYAEGSPVNWVDPMGLRSATTAEIGEFALEWWLKRQARPGRATPWGRAIGIGEAIGAAAAVGKFVYDQNCRDDEDDPCELQKEEDILRCNDWNIYGSWGGYTRESGFAVCMQTVYARYAQCRAGGLSNIKTDLFLPGRRPSRRKK